MPKRPRYYDDLPGKLREKLAKVYQILQEVPYINKQQFDKWQERFCYSPEPEREIAIWEWLAREYKEQTASVQNQREKNRIFKRLLSKSVDYEPLGVRKLPEWRKGTRRRAQGELSHSAALSSLRVWASPARRFCSWRSAAISCCPFQAGQCLPCQDITLPKEVSGFRLA